MNYRQKLKNIKALVFDIDGVFSKYMLLDAEGNLLRTMNPKDGLAVRIAVEEGFKVGIISGSQEKNLRKRFLGLGVHDIYLNTRMTKLQHFQRFIAKYNLDPDQVLYMGDDLTDYYVMQAAGFAACPADAVSEIKAIAHYISERPAAEGCVREIIEQVLRVQGKWENFLKRLKENNPSGL